MHKAFGMAPVDPLCMLPMHTVILMVYSMALIILVKLSPLSVVMQYSPSVLTPYMLMTQWPWWWNSDLDKHWFSWWFDAGWHEAIPWIIDNVSLKMQSRGFYNALDSNISGDIMSSTVTTEAKHRPDLELTNYTQQLYCEDWRENVPHYNGITLY